MPPLTEDFQRSRMTARKIELVSLPVAAGVHLFVGAIACRNDANRLVPGADAPGLFPVGVVHRGLDNRDGPDGTYGPPEERTAAVDVASLYLFDTTYSLGAEPKYGDPAYLVDDNTVSAQAGSNAVRVGSFVRPFEGDLEAWYVDPQRR